MHQPVISGTGVFTPSGDVTLADMGPYSSAAGAVRCQGASEGVPATLYVFRCPKSYTREDVFEVHFPGSLPLAEMLLEDLLQRGARMAEPGEFTRRAFENGRIDLTKVEAVLALISSHNRAQSLAALRQIDGSLARAVTEVAECLVEVLSLAELSIDFSEEKLGRPHQMRFGARALYGQTGDAARLAASE